MLDIMGEGAREVARWVGRRGGGLKGMGVSHRHVHAHAHPINSTKHAHTTRNRINICPPAPLAPFSPQTPLLRPCPPAVYVNVCLSYYYYTMLILHVYTKPLEPRATKSHLELPRAPLV